MKLTDLERVDGEKAPRPHYHPSNEHQTPDAHHTTSEEAHRKKSHRSHHGSGTENKDPAPQHHNGHRVRTKSQVGKEMHPLTTDKKRQPTINRQRSRFGSSSLGAIEEGKAVHKPATEAKRETVRKPTGPLKSPHRISSGSKTSKHHAGKRNDSKLDFKISEKGKALGKTENNSNNSH